MCGCVSRVGACAVEHTHAARWACSGGGRRRLPHLVALVVGVDQRTLAVHLALLHGAGVQHGCASLWWMATPAERGVEERGEC